MADEPAPWEQAEEWACACGEITTVRHWISRGGVLVHDPEAAYREAAGLDAPEPNPPRTDESSP